MIYGFIKSELDGTEYKFNQEVKVPEEFRYSLPKVLNQGQRPICVPCSISSFLNWDINLKTGTSTTDNKINVEEIFKHGGSTNGMQFKDALNYLVDSKQINNYGIVGNMDSLKSAIILNGPCVGGLPVYNDQISDFWDGTTFLGGHAISIVGWTKEGFIIRNSWGENFGNKGYVILPYSEFDKFREIWTLIK